MRSASRERRRLPPTAASMVCARRSSAATASSRCCSASSTGPQAPPAALAYPVGVEDPDHPFSDMEPRQVRTETHAAWRSFFSALAGGRAAVAVVEDIHWADPELLDLLAGPP